MTLLDVQDVPQVDDDSNTDGDDGQDAIDFRSPSEGHKSPSSEDPNPPVPGEVPARMTGK